VLGHITGTELPVTKQIAPSCSTASCAHQVHSLWPSTVLPLYIHSTTYRSQQLSYVLERVQSGNSYMTNMKTYAICILIHMIKSSIRHFPCYQWRGPGRQRVWILPE